MKPKETYSYEILIVDETGKTEITCVKSLLLALSYSEKLWKNAVVKTTTIEDKSLDIQLTAQKVSSNDSALESAFLIKVKSSTFDKTEAFRQNFLSHTKKKLGFTTIRVLTDGISTKIAQDIYPLIAEVENALRSYIAKYHIQNTGIQWWSKTATKTIIDKVNNRKKNEGVFAELVDMDISLTDFEDLTILSQKTFSGTTFQPKWEQLSVIRKNVMYNHLFVSKDYTTATKLTNDLLKLIADAEQKTGALKVKAPTTTSKTEKPVKIIKKATSKPVAKKPVTAKTVTPKQKPKTVVAKAQPVKKEIPVKPIIEETPPSPIAKTEEPKQEVAPVEVKVEQPRPVITSSDSFKMISEDDLLEELKIAESSSSSFIDLKVFVNEVLVPKGYASGPTFSLARMMSGKGLVSIYDTKDAQGMPIKAVKTQ